MNFVIKIYLTIIGTILTVIIGSLIFNHFNPWVAIIFIFTTSGIAIYKSNSLYEWIMKEPKIKKQTKSTKLTKLTKNKK